MEEEAKKSSIIKFYQKKYKILLLIPLIMLILAMVQIGYQVSSTGDFLNKGVSLKGGTTISIEKFADSTEIKDFLIEEFPEADLSVRYLSKSGVNVGLIIEASDVDDNLLVNSLKNKLSLNDDQFSVETIGSSLGASFFQETFRAIILSFLFMGIVVFFYFGEDLKSKLIAVVLTAVAMPVIYTSASLIMYLLSIVLVVFLILIYLKSSVPSLAVILAAFSDIIITLAIVNLLGIKLSTAGIAAFLMLIGYSVDTDILLSTKVLKQKKTNVDESILDAMKTGLLMSVTTITAIVIALSFAQAEVLKQIMIILLIGLLVDIPNTWLQNAGILKWYLERKEKKYEQV